MCILPACLCLHTRSHPGGFPRKVGVAQWRLADINIQPLKIKQFPDVVCIFWLVADEINSPGDVYMRTFIAGGLINSMLDETRFIHKDTESRWVFLSQV